MNDTYRVFKYDDNAEEEHVWLEVSEAWVPDKSWVSAEEIGGAFGTGAYLLIPESGKFGRVEEQVVVAKQVYEFETPDEGVPA